MNNSSDNNFAYDCVWYNAQLACMTNTSVPYGLIDNAAIAIQNGRIVWIGDSQEIADSKLQQGSETLDCGGNLVTPGLIDCHTHLVYAGNRAIEFEQRLKGASYEDIAHAGGGINSTVESTRNASQSALFDQSLQRLQGFMAEGVTTIEIKSGYGLNLDDEAKMLRVARKLGESFPVNICTTFLGAHSIPTEYQDRSDDYIDWVCESVLPPIAEENLVDAVDAFCETIAFTPLQVDRIFDAASALQLPIKLHAEQLSDSKGAVLASKRGAMSVDHLEYLAEKDVSVLAENDTVAVLLPGAYYYLRETQQPPLEALRKHKVAVALASDCNPGSSPTGSLLLMLNLACVLFSMTPEEALAGVTRNAAKALNLLDEIGTLEVGKSADIVLWNATNPAELSYHIAGNPCQKVMLKGKCR